MGNSHNHISLYACRKFLKRKILKNNKKKKITATVHSKCLARMDKNIKSVQRGTGKCIGKAWWRAECGTIHIFRVLGT